MTRGRTTFSTTMIAVSLAIRMTCGAQPPGALSRQVRCLRMRGKCVSVALWLLEITNQGANDSHQISGIESPRQIFFAN